MLAEQLLEGYSGFNATVNESNIIDPTSYLNEVCIEAITALNEAVQQYYIGDIIGQSEVILEGYTGDALMESIGSKAKQLWEAFKKKVKEIIDKVIAKLKKFIGWIKSKLSKNTAQEKNRIAEENYKKRIEEKQKREDATRKELDKKEKENSRKYNMRVEIENVKNETDYPVPKDTITTYEELMDDNKQLLVMLSEYIDNLRDPVKALDSMMKNKAINTISHWEPTGDHSRWGYEIKGWSVQNNESKDGTDAYANSFSDDWKKYISSNSKCPKRFSGKQPDEIMNEIQKIRDIANEKLHSTEEMSPEKRRTFCDGIIPHIENTRKECNIFLKDFENTIKILEDIKKYVDYVSIDELDTRYLTKTQTNRAQNLISSLIQRMVSKVTMMANIGMRLFNSCVSISNTLEATVRDALSERARDKIIADKIDEIKKKYS